MKIFIDGKEGTTGLEIESRLQKRGGITLLSLPEESRKDPSARKQRINEADAVFLCLPDAAARESVALCENPRTVIIDASTAHRTDPKFAYGFPELSTSHRERIASSKRIAVPGCHAGGFASIVYPLVAGGIIGADYPLCCHSITGYSGGGKKMIAEYEANDRSPLLSSPRQYSLGQTHKHLPEMKAVCGLDYFPQFSPIVADFYRGMAVSVPLHGRLLKAAMTAEKLCEYYQNYYAGCKFIRVLPFGDEGGFFDALALAGTNKMEIAVCGNDERMTIISRFDNLGKGASGAAVQCMNIAVGANETMGLKGE